MATATQTAKPRAATTPPLTEAPKSTPLATTSQQPQTPPLTAATAPPEVKEQAKKAGQVYLDNLFSEENAAQMTAALANSLPYDTFKSSVATAVMNNPDLLTCKPGLLLREVIRIARLGLVFDVQLGEAYLFASYHKGKKDVPQARVGYRGLMKLAKNESDADIYAYEVRANDHFECELGLARVLIHKPKIFSSLAERGTVIGYYAVIKFKDGSNDFEPMSLDEVEVIRDRTEAYKAFIAKKIFSTPWQTDPVEMGKKTAIRRLMKRQSMGPKVNEAIAINDDADNLVDVTPAGQQPAPRTATPTPALDRFAPRPNNVTDVPSGESENPAPAANAEQPQQRMMSDIIAGLPGESVNVLDPSDDEPVGPLVAATTPAYVEPGDEETPPIDSEAHPGNDAGGGEDDAPAIDEAAAKHEALLALAPKMPAEIEDQWTKDAKPIPAWKWFCETMQNLTDVAVKQAVTDEHKAMLHGMAGKSAGYKQAVDRFLAANNVKLAEVVA